MCQYLYFCNSIASKLRTSVARRHLLDLALPPLAVVPLRRQHLAEPVLNAPKFEGSRKSVKDLIKLDASRKIDLVSLEAVLVS